ncbi:HPP family protein [Catellatospora paridis]|uniref:HPP family protein n=1 Tax=Catellatospora paridis TaxID=1617086 RepID=UPI0012D46C50|nr:HPP family protein [Catellatospora paridis]
MGVETGKAFSGSVVAMAVAGTAALVTQQPWLFPSLGPTVMLHVEQPRAPQSSPRSTLYGHGIALLVGYAALVVCGLADEPSALQAGVSAPRIAAAAGSLGLTAALLVPLRATHPPAGATTLIVSLGLLHTPSELLVAFAAVVLVTVVDGLFCRVTGPTMPLWRIKDR